MANLETAKTLQLPPPPWTHEALGEAKYCELARALSFFDPTAESASYRPTLDCGPYLTIIAAQHAAKPGDKPKE